MLKLGSERLIISEIREEDTDLLHAIFSDPDVCRYMEYIKSGSPEQTAKWVKETMKHNDARPRSSYNFSVFTGADGALIGWIGFGRADEKHRHVGGTDFGYAFGKSCWNKGYGTEALGRIVDFVFSEVATDVFWGECNKRNPASGRAMEKAGLNRIADLSEDSFCYRITRAEWERGGRERFPGSDAGSR